MGRAEGSAVLSPNLWLGSAPRAPRCPRGQIRFEWLDELDTAVVCHLAIEAAEEGEREHGTGLQLGPDWPLDISLCAAYVRDIDILPLLSAAQVTAIEDAALAAAEEEAADGYH